MSYNFVFDGWIRVSKAAKRQNVGCYKLCGGFYNPKTKRITLNLDIQLQGVCYDCGGWCRKEKGICIDELIGKFTRIVTHEHVHKILDVLDNGYSHGMDEPEHCTGFDNISKYVEGEG